MVTDEDRRYYERRAEMELEMAAGTDDPNACASHYTLANLYLALVFDGKEVCSDLVRIVRDLSFEVITLDGLAVIGHEIEAKRWIMADLYRDKQTSVHYVRGRANL